MRASPSSDSSDNDRLPGGRRCRNARVSVYDRPTTLGTTRGLLVAGPTQLDRHADTPARHRPQWPFQTCPAAATVRCWTIAGTLPGPCRREAPGPRADSAPGLERSSRCWRRSGFRAGSGRWTPGAALAPRINARAGRRGRSCGEACRGPMETRASWIAAARRVPVGRAGAGAPSIDELHCRARPRARQVELLTFCRSWTTSSPRAWRRMPEPETPTGWLS